jgi:hypothetical protein
MWNHQNETIIVNRADQISLNGIKLMQKLHVHTDLSFLGHINRSLGSKNSLLLSKKNVRLEVVKHQNKQAKHKYSQFCH